MPPSSMIALAAVIALLLVLPEAPAAPQAAPRAWRLSEFMLSLWGGPNSQELARCLAEDARFNTVMGGPGLTGEQGVGILNLAQEHGLRVLLKIDPKDVTEDIRTHAGLWGYYGFDEPVQQKVAYADLVPLVQAFRAADPLHPVYVNLNNADDPVAVLDILGIDLLSLDRYQWWYGREDYFPLLERYRALSLERDVPLLWWVEANADENRYNYPPDNRQKLRQSVFTALAYGVKGIQWFGWGEACSWEPTPGTGRWRLKPAGQDVAAINSELHNLGPILLTLRSVDVWHTPPLPPSTRPVPESCWVQTDTPNLVLGLFRHPQGQDLVLVANRDHQARVQTELTMAPDMTKFERLNKQTGDWVHLPAMGNGRVPLSLEAGDGELLRVIR